MQELSAGAGELKTNHGVPSWIRYAKLAVLQTKNRKFRGTAALTNIPIPGCRGHPRYHPGSRTARPTKLHYNIVAPAKAAF